VLVPFTKTTTPGIGEESEVPMTVPVTVWDVCQAFAEGNDANRKVKIKRTIGVDLMPTRLIPLHNCLTLVMLSMYLGILGYKYFNRIKCVHCDLKTGV
jgi:hypothetical protein